MLFRHYYPKVFISYTRRPGGLAHDAERLASQLRHFGTKLFLDRESIELGASWRRRLLFRMAESNVVVTLVDRQSVQSDWPAVEMETALRGRAKTGLPEIIVLLAKDLPELPETGWRPVFRELVDAQREGVIGLPRIIRMQENTVDVVAYGLRPYVYLTPGILPGRLSRYLRVLLTPIVWVGTLSTSAGNILLALAVAARVREWDMGKIPLAGGWLGAILCACGYWLGFAARLAVSTLFEEKSAPVALVVAVLASLLGITVAALPWFGRAEPLAEAWAGWFAVVGWYLAEDFTNVVGYTHVRWRRG